VVTDVVTETGPVYGTRNLAVATGVELTGIGRAASSERSHLFGHGVDTFGPAPIVSGDISVGRGFESVRPVAR
jgi:hypothetical protein